MPYAYEPEIGAVMAPLMAMRAGHPAPAVHDIATRRQNFAMMVLMLSGIPMAEDVTTKIYTTKTADGHTLEMTWFYKIGTSSTPGPAVLHAHGGGMILGSVKDLCVFVTKYVSQSSVPFLSIEYRYAPEYKHPTPVEDCYTGLTWLRDNAKELNIDPARISIMGESAGGGIAAGVALMARDRKFTPPLVKQILIYPMLDDRTTVPDKDLLPFISPWNYDDNITGWSALLGKDVIGTDQVSEYAAPARAKDVSGLPPTYIDVGGLDIFWNEDMEYARRLAAAQVSVEFHFYPGCPHAFDALALNSDVSKRAMADRVRALRALL